MTWRAKSAGFRINPQQIRGNTHDRTRKNPSSDELGFWIWWSWRDLNPRPQAIFEQIYMFSGLV